MDRRVGSWRVGRGWMMGSTDDNIGDGLVQEKGATTAAAGTMAQWDGPLIAIYLPVLFSRELITT